MASFLKAFKYAHFLAASLPLPDSSHSASLVRRPMLTQCASSAVMFGVGDILAQQAFEKKGTKHDVRPLPSPPRAGTSADVGPAADTHPAHSSFAPPAPPSTAVPSSGPSSQNGSSSSSASASRTVSARSSTRSGSTRPSSPPVCHPVRLLAASDPRGHLLTRMSPRRCDRILLHLHDPPRGQEYPRRPAAPQRGTHHPILPAHSLSSHPLTHTPAPQAYVPTLVRNWGVFVPTQILNFWLVPAQYRFFAVNTVALFWNAYLSAVNARTAQAHPAPAVDAHSLEEIEAGVPADGALAAVKT